MKPVLILFIVMTGCFQNCYCEDKYKLPSKDKFNQYWYQQGAEITSYELNQHRYTENRKGYVVRIFVTEPFDKIKQVKADNYKKNKNAVQILKLNQIKKFNTGIYQYSLMNSIFTPLQSNDLMPLKTSTSIQEWCGHTFLQMNRKVGGYQLSGFSYFESEGDVNIKIHDVTTEDGLWNLIRINPNKLPLGEIMIIPAANYLQLMHKKIKAYKTILSLRKLKDKSVYSIEIAELKRKMVITFENNFPFKILSSNDSYERSGKSINTTEKLHKTIHSFYWSKNKNKDYVFQEKLGLNKLLKISNYSATLYIK